MEISLVDSSKTPQRSQLKGTDGNAHTLTHSLDSVTELPVADESVGGAKSSYLAGSVYGPHPATYYDGSALAVTMAASASGTTVITSGDLTTYNQTVFEVVAIGGTTPALKVYPSFDGTTFAATPIALINLNDLTVIDGDTGVSAIGIFAVGTPPGGALKIKKLKWVQTGGAADQTCQLRGGHGWV